MKAAVAFFRGLAGQWDRSQDRTPARALEIRVIGAGALDLLTDFSRGTRDHDVIRTEEVGGASARLLEIAGPGSDLAKRHRMFLEFVPPGLPFLPQSPRYLPVPGLEDLRSIRVRALHPADVAVSKLRPFRAHDEADIAELVRLGVLDHADYLARFRSAVELASLGARLDEMPGIVARFHRIEQDYFGTGPSPIETPED